MAENRGQESAVSRVPIKGAAPGAPRSVADYGAKSLEFWVMIQVWQVGIINTQRFEKYFLLM